jgi:hypothetical protein
MTNRPVYEYEIRVNVQRKHLLTVPIADFHVSGRLDPGREFTQQVAAIFTRYLAEIQPKLERARRA